MTIEIKTATLEPVRNTFGHIERRFGDKPASRYQEATYDVMATDNFHYRPLWEPEHQLNDPTRTAIKMEDWYAFRDPRQLYYGAYVQARAKMQETAEHSYSFFDKRKLGERLPEELKQQLIRFLIPLRHFEHTANLNNLYGTSRGYGTAFTQALLYNGMDRLGIAQYLSRIGLLIDGNSGDSLAEAKEYWMTDEVWQPLRELCETSLLTKDYFELFVGQDVVTDTLVYHLFYEQFDQQLTDNGGSDIGALTDFMRQWAKESNRWVDSSLKIAASESAENRALLTQWVTDWKERAVTALTPVATELLGPGAMDSALTALDVRLKKAGLLG